MNFQCISSVATAACYVSFGGRVARNFLARSRSWPGGAAFSSEVGMSKNIQQCKQFVVNSMAEKKEMK